MKDFFDGLDSKVVQHLSEHPEALTNEKYVKSAAAQAMQVDPSNPAFDGSSRTPINVPLPPQMIFALNLTLLGDYFETELYSRALNLGGLIPNDLRQTFVRILLNEVTHREILLTVLGSNAIPKPQFLFNNRLINTFASFDAFTGVAQTSEDMGVRAIKGQAPNVQPDDFVLTTALRFHSVEARHAAELRMIRGQKPYITLNDRGNLPPFAQPVYDGEENTTQLGINLVALTGLPAATVSEAFDEPLPAQTVLNVLRPFLRRPIFIPGQGAIPEHNEGDSKSQ